MEVQSFLPIFGFQIGGMSILAFFRVSRLDVFLRSMGFYIGSAAIFTGLGFQIGGMSVLK